MSNFNAVGWFALGAMFGAGICSFVLHRWAIREMRKTIKAYHDSIDLMDQAQALVDEEPAAVSRIP